MTTESREKAIHWLEWELRSLRRAPEINGCPMTPEWAEQISVLETCLEAVRGYGNDPLTLEQLRNMDGKPVWGVSLINGKPGEWFIVRVVNMSQCWFIACAGASQGFGDKDTYGKTWLAYAYPPANIEREAWISVKERLPNKGQNVLVFCNSRYAKGWKFAIDRLEEGEKNPIWIYTHGWFEVTHWMPLPEPPGNHPQEGENTYDE